MSAPGTLVRGPPPGPVLVGFSGGLDSSVLLHALAQQRAYRQTGLRAIHVHHGLHPEADAWAAQCQAICTAWKIVLHVIRVEVARNSGLGPEGAARAARRAAFAAQLAPGEWLALAQHRDDQAETFLLRALRGAGPDGLAAMRAQRPFAAGTLWRPLLALPRTMLSAYARAHGLTWINDPSNADTRYDRNFLRHTVLPLLRQRWPHAEAVLTQSAGLCGEANTLLEVEDAALLTTACRADGALDLIALRSLSTARRKRLLRAWVVRQDAPALPACGVQILEQEMLQPASDRQTCFAWRGVEVRRWRQAFHLYRPRPAWPPGWQCQWDGRMPLALPDGASLHLLGAITPGFVTPLLVRARCGGERMLLPQRRHSHRLKHLLQAIDLPPWQRDTLPLLCSGGQVLAAGDRLIGAALAQWLHTHGARLCWQPPVGTN